MLAQEEYVEAHALRKRGWSISAIARHLGRDRKTVRAHLSGERVPGQRAASEPDPFEVIKAYVRQRLAEDPHLWATSLFDEAKKLGYDQSYVTFARKIRSRQLRPSCGTCGGRVWSKGYRTAVLVDLPACGRVGASQVAETPLDVSEPRLCAEVVRRARPHDCSAAGVADVPGGKMGDHPGRSSGPSRRRSRRRTGL